MSCCPGLKRFNVFDVFGDKLLGNLKQQNLSCCLFDYLGGRWSKANNSIDVVARG